MYETGCSFPRGRLDIPRSGSKAKDGEKKEKGKEKKRTMVITMAKLHMVYASTQDIGVNKFSA